MVYTSKGTFEGWDILSFLKGRDKLIITAIGAIAGYLTTHNPIYTTIIAAGAEFLYSLVRFYLKDSSD